LKWYEGRIGTIARGGGGVHPGTNEPRRPNLAKGWLTAAGIGSGGPN